MIVKRLGEIIGTDNDVKAENGNWASRRFLLKKDGMGFSFHDTTIFAGTETYIWYKNHLEAVYCIDGEGELEDLDNGEVHEIRKPFDAASIGSAIATRAIMEDLRAGMDGVGGGPPPFSKADRSNFLQALDRVLVRLGRV